MSFSLSSKTAVITGAYGTLGAATARAAVQAGARVALLDRAAAPPRGLAEDCGPDALLLNGVTLAEPAAVSAAMATVAQRFGGIDILINVAGTFRWQTVADGDPATWDLLYAANLKTAVNCCHAALPFLRKSRSGRIINIGANAARKAGVGMGAYAASKSGVHALTESLAEELKSEGITVNAVLPSVIDTPANRKDMPKADPAKWVSPQALAAVILFLASDAGQPVTGALLPVTGRV